MKAVGGGVGSAEDMAEVAAAMKAASEASLEAAKVNAANAEAARKEEHRAQRGRLISKLFSGPKKIIAIVAIVAVVVVLVGGFTVYNQLFNKTQYLSASSLTNVVQVSKLSTAQIEYEGIADKLKDDSNEAQYHVYYSSTVTASTDMSKIEFKVDNDKKTVTPVLPEPTIGNPVIDDTSFEYLPRNPNAQLKDVVKICKEDAKRDAGHSELLLATARRNLQSTVEALVKPVLDSAGYTLEWDESAQAAEENAGDKNE